MPKTATIAALLPTRKTAAGFVSNPTVKSRKMTPISASVFVISDGAAMLSRLGPMMIPASISPTTAGCLSRANSYAINFAATNMTKSVNKISVPCPVFAAKITLINQ